MMNYQSVSGSSAENLFIELFSDTFGVEKMCIRDSQKGILLLMIAMVIIFTVFYAKTISRVGFAYQGAILVPVSYTHLDVYKRQHPCMQRHTVWHKYPDRSNLN